MDITDAVKYKLQGKHIDCSKCSHFGTFHDTITDRLDDVCAKSPDIIKADRTMCPQFHRGMATGVNSKYAFENRTLFFYTNAAMTPLTASFLKRRYQLLC